MEDREIVDQGNAVCILHGKDMSTMGKLINGQWACIYVKCAIVAVECMEMWGGKEEQAI
jgi:hypothetical protein